MAVRDSQGIDQKMIAILAASAIAGTCAICHTPRLDFVAMDESGDVGLYHFGFGRTVLDRTLGANKHQRNIGSSSPTYATAWQKSAWVSRIPI